jgi:signal transduction histidine kinase
MPGPRTWATVIVMGTLLIVAIFVASTVYTRARLGATNAALSVATNGAPSLSYLAAARAELRDLRGAAERLTLGSSDWHAREDMQRARRRLQANVEAELRTPSYPNEQIVERRVVVALRQLDDVGAQSRGEPQQSVLAFDSAADELDRRLDQLERHNAAFMQADANTLLDRQRQGTRLIVDLQVANVMLAALITLGVLHLVRGYLELAERRARELEYFAVQVAHDLSNPLTPIQVTLDLCRLQVNNAITRAAITRSSRGVERLRQASERLLTFARAGTPPATTDRAELRPLVDAAIATFGEGRARVEPFADCRVRAQPAVIEGLLATFLREAVARSAPGADVVVSVRGVGHCVRVEVAMARDGRAPLGRRLFAPRIRGPLSGCPGIDLELAAARRVVEAHHGRLGCGDVGAMTILWFQLPEA